MKNINIAVAVLLLSSISNVQAQVPVLEFYKDGKVIYTDASQNGTNAERPVGNFEVLSAAEHPVKNHIKFVEINATPSTSDGPWQLDYRLITDLRYGGRRIYVKVSPALPIEKIHPNISGLSHDYRYSRDAQCDSIDLYFEWVDESRGYIPCLEKQTEYTFTFYEEAYGLTFKTDDLKVKTGYSEADALKERNLENAEVLANGARIALPDDVVIPFLQKHEWGQLAVNVRKYIADYMQTYSISDIKKISTEVPVYEGSLYVVNEIPDAAATYIADLLGKKNVVPGGEGEVPMSYDQASMNMEEITNGVTGDTYWEITAKQVADQTQVTYTTAGQLPGKYVNLYVTMASGRGQNQSVEESLPVSFTAECQVLNEEGKYVRSGIDAEGTPVTNNGFLCNQHPEWNYDVPELQGQPNFQRCYLVKNDTGRKVYLGTVKVDNFGPMQLTFKSFGPAATKYKEKVYTRTLRIANIITEPFDTEEEAKAAIDDSGNEKQ